MTLHQTFESFSLAHGTSAQLAELAARPGLYNSMKDRKSCIDDDYRWLTATVKLLSRKVSLCGEQRSHSYSHWPDSTILGTLKAAYIPYFTGQRLVCDRLISLL